VQKGSGFMTAVENQYKRLKAKLAGLSTEDRASLRPENTEGSLAAEYRGFADLNSGDLQKQAESAYKNGGKWDGITCSLVENVEINKISAKTADEEAVEIEAPATSFGHVIHIPDFGTVFLAELKVNHNSFNLTMIHIEMGCLSDGNLSLSTANVNGGGKPPGP
jgi:hypothetical protein